MLRKGGDRPRRRSGRSASTPAPSGAPGSTSTVDNTLRRKATVCAGDTNGGDAFDPAVAVGRLRQRHVRRPRRAHQLTAPTDDAPAVASVDPGGRRHRRRGEPVRSPSARPSTPRLGASRSTCRRALPWPSRSPVARPRTPLDPTADLAAAGDVRRHGRRRRRQPTSTPTTRRTRWPPSHALRLHGRPPTPARRPRSPDRRDPGLGPAAAVAGRRAPSAASSSATTRARARRCAASTSRTAGDGDPATSDGIFVFDGGADLVANGDVVRSPAPPREFQDQTQISGDRGQRRDVRHRHGHAGRRHPARRRRRPRSSSTRACSCASPRRSPSPSTSSSAGSARSTCPRGDRLRRSRPTSSPRGRRDRRSQAANDLNQIIVDDATQRRRTPTRSCSAAAASRSAPRNTLRGGDTAHRRRRRPDLHLGRQRGQPQRLPAAAASTRSAAAVDFAAEQPAPDVPRPPSAVTSQVGRR